MDSMYVTVNGRRMARVIGGEPRPWDADLATRFTDPETRQAVSDFLAANVQPYITRLEQERPPDEAAQLYNDFRTDPLDTFKRITEELVEGDVLTSEAIAELFSVPPEGEPQTSTAEPESELTPEQARKALEALGLDPDQLKAATESTLSKDANEEYDRVVNDLVEANPEYFKHPREADKDVRSWIDAHMLTAQGNPEQAIESYKNWYTDAFGDPTAEPASPTPPTTIDGEGAAAGTPTEKKYTGPDGLDNAIDDFFAEQRASSEPPAVGSV